MRSQAVWPSYPDTEVPASVLAFEALEVEGAGQDGKGVHDQGREEIDAIVKKYAFNKVRQK